jgi:hypothetical protein
MPSVWKPFLHFFLTGVNNFLKKSRAFPISCPFKKDFFFGTEFSAYFFRMINLKKYFSVTVVIFPLLLSSRGDSASVMLCRADAPILIFSAGYRMPLSRSVILNSGHGLSLEAGVNAGRLISKRMIIGLYAGWNWKDMLWSTSFNHAFTQAYKTSGKEDAGFSSLDSSIISNSASLFESKKGNSLTMPGCEMNSFHNYSLYYGLLIKLPRAYIPALKIYTGFTRSQFLGAGEIVTHHKDYNIFELRRAMRGCELIIFHGMCINGKIKTGSLSFFYESYNFSNASLYFSDGETRRNILLRNYMSASFMNQFKREIVYGVKLSFSVM